MKYVYVRLQKIRSTAVIDVETRLRKIWRRPPATVDILDANSRAANMTEVVGWASSAVLLLTIITQVRKQWTTGSNKGVSKWLFVGQVLASLGFTIYSVLTSNAVFIVTNSMLLVSSIVGLWRFYRNR